MPWEVGTPTAAAFVSRGLRDYGLALTAEGTSTMTLLPLPRLSFTRTRITAARAGTPALIDGGSLDLELNPLALLSGQAEIGALVLGGATIHLPEGADDVRWAEPIRRVAARLAKGGSNHPRRVALTGTTIEAPTPGGGAQAVDLTLAWPLWSASLDVAATLSWRGARTSMALFGLRASDLLKGSDSPYTLSAAWPTGSLNAEGTVAAADGLAIKGQGRIETGSLPDTLAWIGGDVALAPFIRTLALEGRFETVGRTLSFSSLRATLGDDILDGAGSVRFGEGRTSVQATLAADSLNLAPLLGGLVRVFDSDPGEGHPASGSPADRPGTAHGRRPRSAHLGRGEPDRPDPAAGSRGQHAGAAGIGRSRPQPRRPPGRDPEGPGCPGVIRRGWRRDRGEGARGFRPGSISERS